MHKRTMKLAIPVATFVAGVLIPLLADHFTSKEINTSTRLLVAAVGGLAVLVVILSIVIASDYVDRAQEYDDRARKVTALSGMIEGLSARFGLSVEFVSDRPGADDGLTYERTRQLIAEAERSLVFVDYWSESGSYRASSSIAHARRRAYYNEILEKVTARTHHNPDDGPFHRRIIQADLDAGDGHIVLAGDDSFVSYLNRCLKLQEVSARATVLKVCPPLVFMHFAIIDYRHVVLPILTAMPHGEGSRRHGALIFEDRVGQLVARLMEIYEMLDASAQPLTQRHIQQGSTT